MELYFGVYIGGKREVDVNDWAEFEIDAALLDGESLTLLPESHYELADPNTFRVRKSNLPVADVGITFTEAFYADPNSTKAYYALPMKIVDYSLDAIAEGKSHSLIAVKYVSTFSGTYYVRGEERELYNTGSEWVVMSTRKYYNADLSQNIARELTTLSRTELLRNGLADLAPSDVNRLKLTVEATDDSDREYNVVVEKADGSGAVNIAGGSGTYYGNEEHPRFHLTYEYTMGGKRYQIEEDLYLRQDPLYDLRVETWN
jgi:hypothetical protein